MAVARPHQDYVEAGCNGRGTGRRLVKTVTGDGPLRGTPGQVDTHRISSVDVKVVDVVVGDGDAAVPGIEGGGGT